MTSDPGTIPPSSSSPVCDQARVRERIESMSDSPFHRRNWTGKIVSADGASTQDFAIDDVARIAHLGETDGWNGTSAGVVELADGRFVSWESLFEPSGAGFYCDFYGGDADVFVARTEAAALSMISEQARELFDVRAVSDVNHDVNHDADQEEDVDA